MPYKDIYKIRENDSYIILMLTKELASVICKKDLDKEDIEKIIAGKAAVSEPCDPKGLFLQEISY